MSNVLSAAWEQRNGVIAVKCAFKTVLFLTFLSQPLSTNATFLHDGSGVIMKSVGGMVSDPVGLAKHRNYVECMCLLAIPKGNL